MAHEIKGLVKYRDFSKHFLLPLFGGKNWILNLQLSFETQSSIFYHFPNSDFITNIEVIPCFLL